MWPDRRITDLFGVEHPILLAPMAGPSTPELGIAVSEAGGLGCYACALSTPEQIRTAMSVIRQRTDKPVNLNFFTHTQPVPDADREARWKARLSPYYSELGIDPNAPTPTASRAPFDDTACQIVEEFRPEVVSFHFGLRTICSMLAASLTAEAVALATAGDA